MRLVIICFILIYSELVLSQSPVVFTESTEQLGVRVKSAALAKALVDLNGDFRDDILTADKDAINIEFQLNNGSHFEELYNDNIIKDAYTLNVGDFNNDGNNDFLYSGFYNGVIVYHNSEDQFDFDKIQEIDATLYAQGSSLFDINNDGWLDAILTHDDGASLTYLNDGTGLLQSAEIINFETVPPSDNSGNYSAIWVDVNQDNVQDLYISKCRAGVSDANDPRRINTLFINENGTFTEAAHSYGIDLGDQSWCSDSGDLDNDGDMDIVLINHNSPHLLLENNGDETFTIHDSFTNKGAITTHDLEVSIADLNNDGLLDIIIAGTKDYLLLNNGNLEFTRNDNPFGSKNASSVAFGDLNDDGYLDSYISFGGPGTPSFLTDELWLNFPFDNNYVQISLVGTISNKSGIGAQVLCYGDWGKQTRWLNSGVAYGITNSLNIHFGLNQFETIDSLVINWPSGITDRYRDLGVNEHYVATEGSCLNPILKISPSSLILDCNNDSIRLESNVDHDLVWSNGSVASEINIHEPGYYTLRSSDTDCSNSAASILISELDALETPSLDYIDSLTLCQGDLIALSTSLDTALIWQDGMITEEYIVSLPGSYYAINSNYCDTVFSEAIIIKYEGNEYESDTIIIDEIKAYELTVAGENINWYSDPSGINFLHAGNTFFVDEINSDTTFFFQSTSSRELQTFTAGIFIDSTELIFGSENANGGLSFEIFYPSIIHSFNVYSDTSVSREFIIKQNSDTIFTKRTDLNFGINTITIEKILDAGEYYITTNEELNLEHFGSISPRLKIAENEDVNFPYEAGNILSIIDSNFGSSTYFYFFDWIAELYFDPCVSEIIPVHFNFDTSTSVQNVDGTTKHMFKYFPNPVRDYIYFHFFEPIDYFAISDALGRSIIRREHKNILNDHKVDMSQFPSGLYYIEIRNSKKRQVGKFYKF